MENVVIVEHSTGHKHIPLNSPKFSVGRGLDNSHVVDDISVSRKHAVFELKNNEWYIFDLSSNGTWLNFHLMRKNRSYRLTHGDIIKLSDSCKYTFKVKSPDLYVTTNSYEEEIAVAVQEVVANAEVFNSEFSVDSVESGAACLPPNGENVAVPSSSSGSEQPITTPDTQPSTSNNNENSCSSNLMCSQQASSSKMSKCSIEFVEDELQCSICAEMFIGAVTLACSHTFCSYCIEQWKKTKSNCPICRTPITTQCRTIILDNYIEKIVETASDVIKKHRRDVIAQRKIPESAQDRLASSSRAATPPEAVIVLSEDEYDEDDDDSCDSDSSCSTKSAPYYGGYGKCYSCGHTGHWANNCPKRRRRY